MKVFSLWVKARGNAPNIPFVRVVLKLIIRDRVSLYIPYVIFDLLKSDKIYSFAIQNTFYVV